MYNLFIHVYIYRYTYCLHSKGDPLFFYCVLSSRVVTRKMGHLIHISYVLNPQDLPTIRKIE